MKTIFPFTLQIDDESFELQYSNPSKKESEDFTNSYKTLKQSIDFYEELEQKIKNLNEKKELYQELIKIKKGDEKEELIKTTLDLLSQIDNLEVCFKELDRKNIDLEDLSLKRFELSISKNKEALKECIEKKGISYYDIMIAIDEAVQKEKEKK